MVQQSRLTRGRLFARILSWPRDTRGNVAPIAALLLVPIIGALSMGVEASSWFFMGRAAQNAADSAAVAAANNAVSTEYVAEGRANAKQYGFVHNPTNGVTVDVASGVTCPDGKAACYRATVTKAMPIYLTRIVGFNGAALNGQRVKYVTSTALAEPISAITYPSCLTALGPDSSSPTGHAIQAKGSPKADMPGCSVSAVGSSSSMDCNGNNGLGAYYGFATSTIDSKCKFTVGRQNQPSSAFCNPYASTQPANCPASSIASNVASAVSGATTPCTLSSGKLTAVTSSCTISGTPTLTLGGTITGPSTGAVVVITNGNLNMAGNSSSNVTYVFNGSSPGTFAGGDLNITAPTAGLTSGIAAWQTSSSSSPTLASWSDAGNSKYTITGLLYLPYTNADFKGAISEASTGECFITVFNSFATNGTAYSLKRSGCSTAGLNALPTVLQYRAALVG